MPHAPVLVAGFREVLWLHPDGEIAVEHDARRKLPAEAGPLIATDARRYGESALAFYRHGPR